VRKSYVARFSAFLWPTSSISGLQCAEQRENVFISSLDSQSSTHQGLESDGLGSIVLGHGGTGKATGHHGTLNNREPVFDSAVRIECGKSSLILLMTIRSHWFWPLGHYLFRGTPPVSWDGNVAVSRFTSTTSYGLGSSGVAFFWQQRFRELLGFGRVECSR